MSGWPCPFRGAKDLVVMVVAAALVGVAVGSLAALFGRVLLAVTDLRTAYPLYLIPFLGIVGFCIIKGYRRWGGNSMQGMALVFEAAHHGPGRIPLRLIPLVIVSTWLTHLFGGSAGREGVAVQIGAAVGSYAGHRLKNSKAPQILLVAGMAAGFSGLFRTPVAAVFFALEVITAGKLLYDALLPALAASYAACLTSSLWGLEKFSVTLQEGMTFSPKTILKLVLLGVVFGLVGRGFAAALHWLKHFLAGVISDGAMRALLVGIAISGVSLLCFFGRYSGLGTNLIGASLQGEAYWMDWLLKFGFTAVTLAAGYQGGEVTPLFAIGASLGAVLALLLGMPVAVVAALGYAAVFGSATNTLLAPVFIGAEVFGFAHMPLFFLVCAVAYGVNGNRSIYAKQTVL